MDTFCERRLGRPDARQAREMDGETESLMTHEAAFPWYLGRQAGCRGHGEYLGPD